MRIIGMMASIMRQDTDRQVDTDMMVTVTMMIIIDTETLTETVA